MKRSAFGEPRPKTADEIGTALDELHIDPSQAMAIIDEEEDGFFAEVIGEESGDFQAGPFETKSDLISALSANNIHP